jgi:MFS family permease
MLNGLIASALVMPALSLVTGFWSAVLLLTIFWPVLGLVVTPSLAYISEAVSGAGVESFGMAYGLYNVAWSIGLMSGPAVGAYLYDHLGFRVLLFLWAPALMALTWWVARVGGK